MPNPAYHQGRQFEQNVKAFIAYHVGQSPVVPAQPRQSDVGDLHIGPYVLQLKTTQAGTANIRKYLAAAEAQADRADLDVGIAVVSTPDAGIGNALAVMRLSDLSYLLYNFFRATSASRD